MKKETLKNLQEILSAENSKKAEDPHLKKFTLAADEYNKLVDQGVIQKRGYTLMTVDQAHLHHLSFNTKK